MSLKIPIIPYKDICFLAITQLFFTNQAEIFYENSGNYYLSIGVNKFRASKPGQKVDPLGGPFGSQLLSRNHVSNFSDLGPPLPLRGERGLNRVILVFLVIGLVHLQFYFENEALDFNDLFQ